MSADLSLQNFKFYYLKLLFKIKKNKQKNINKLQMDQIDL